MWTTFLEGMGGKLAERWLATTLIPAVAFWFVGLAALATHNRAGFLGTGIASLVWPGDAGQLHAPWQWLQSQVEELAGQPTLVQLLIVGGALLFVAMTAIAVDSLVPATLRLLEGYWPSWLRPLWERRVQAAARRQARVRQRWGEFEAQARAGTLTPAEQLTYAAHDHTLSRLPEALMPTQLGNLLRAAETRPTAKYGLSGVTCWPRLWLVMPDATKKELTDARAVLDTFARVWLWSVLALIWVVWTWWAALAGVVVALAAYRAILNAADVYATLIEAAYDIHRMALYQALRWPLPSNPAVEWQEGRQVSSYLLRGSREGLPTFSEPAGNANNK